MDEIRAGSDVQAPWNQRLRTPDLIRNPLQGWVEAHGWQVVLNRAGTTFRALPDADKADLDADTAIALMLAQPSMIKRPVLDLGDRRLVGFKEAEWVEALRR